MHLSKTDAQIPKLWLTGGKDGLAKKYKVEILIKTTQYWAVERLLKSRNTHC